MESALFRKPRESDDESSSSEDVSNVAFSASEDSVPGSSQRSISDISNAPISASSNNQPMTVYSPESPLPSLIPSHHLSILFNSLLESFIRSRITHPATADHALLEISRLLSELGVAPPGSENFARPELSSMRGSALNGLEGLIWQSLHQRSVGGEVGGRAIEGHLSMVLRENTRPSVSTNPSVLARTKTEEFFASQNLDGRRVLQRCSSLTFLSNATKEPQYRPNTAPAFAESPPSFFPTETPPENVLPEIKVTVTPSRYQSDFTEVGFLGRGGFGSVWHVRNRLDGADYAIKKIAIKDEVFKQINEGGLGSFHRIVREVNTMALLEHHNIVRYYASWIDGVIPAGFPSGPAVAVDVNVGTTGQHRGVKTPKNDPASKVEIPCNGNLDKDLDAESMFLFEAGSRVETVDSTSLSKPLSKETDSKETDSQDWVDYTDNESHGPSDESVEDIPRSNSSKNRSGVDPTSQHGKKANVHWIQDAVGVESAEPSGNDSETETSDSAVPTAGSGTMVRPSTKDLGQGPKRSKSRTRVTLHIQMSLHKYGLTSYLYSDRKRSNEGQPMHCFCVLASLRLFHGLLDGVSYLHGRSIVHRDLKPGNIFLDVYEDKGRCKCPHVHKLLVVPRIGDFGLVKNIAEPTGAASPNAAVGTEFYRPPAGMMDDDIFGRDLFALGVILFELVYKFNTKMERAMVLSALTKEGKIPETLDYRIVDIIQGCCSFGPYVEGRWDLEKVRQAIIGVESAEEAQWAEDVERAEAERAEAQCTEGAQRSEEAQCTEEVERAEAQHAGKAQSPRKFAEA